MKPQEARIDEVNIALKALTDKGVTSKLLKRVLSWDRTCPVCNENKAKQVVSMALEGGSNEVCQACGALKDELLTTLGANGLDPMSQRATLNMLKGAAMFGLKESFIPGAPRLVTWELTRRCHGAYCPHCYTNSSSLVSMKEMSKNEAVVVVDKLARAGVLGIAFTGGEALERPDFFEIAGYVRDKGMAFYLATNGALLSEENVQRLKALGTAIVHVSLDSPVPEVHDSFRGSSGLFQRALEGIRRCTQADIQVCIAATATRKTFTTLPGLVELGDQIGADWLLVYDFIPTGRGRAHLDLGPNERKALFEDLYERAKKAGYIRVSAFSPTWGVFGQIKGRGLLAHHYLEPLWASQAPGLVCSSSGCMAGRHYLALEPDGALKPCTFLPIKLGNVLETDLDMLWSSHPILEGLRDAKHTQGECASCQHSNTCGGCRARAYALSGNVLGSDSGCFIQADECNEITHLRAAEG